MDELSWYAVIALVLHWSLVIGLSVRVIMRRRPLGILLAWIALILSVPVLGILIYLFVGENRVSARYLRRGDQLRPHYQGWKRSLCKQADVDWSDISPQAVPLQRQAESLVGFPALPGNRLQLLGDYQQVFASLIDDIDAAQSSCHLEFYIVALGGLADDVLEALIKAAQRGVACRLLVDAMGSKPFLKSPMLKRLEAAGVECAVSLPIGPLSALVSRADLRNHRKIVVIDGEVAYTGSQNLVDPRFFKQEEGLGHWIDAMVRIEGPAVEAMAGTFIQDWEVVTGVGHEHFKSDTDLKSLAHKGSVALQLVPSGPRPEPLAILQLVLSTIYSARHELIVTTPYFIPDDSVLTALMSAAHRGVKVTVIIPAKNDSLLVEYASRAVFDELLAAGVRLARFGGGLLHTKSISVDGEYCLFGSLNLDMRSLWLNFEISVFIYNRDMSAQIRALQLAYLSESHLVSAAECRNRPLMQRFFENAVHLLAPLL